MKGATNLYCGSPEMDTALRDELVKLTKSNAQVIGPGVVSSAAKNIVKTVFARQVLPNVKRVAGKNTDELCSAIFGTLDDDEEHGVLSGSVQLSTFDLSPARPPRGTTPSSPFAKDIVALREVLEMKRAGRARKFNIEPCEPSTRINVLMTSSNEAYVSAAHALPPRSVTAWPPFIEGVTPSIAHTGAPSSAFRKLAEALLWLDVGSLAGKRAIDLGGAPGGWTYVLLEAGAEVTAYDRGKMDPAIMAHERFTHKSIDAFGDINFGHVDIAVCDIIATPDKIVSLLSKVIEGQPRFLVFTLKLQMPLDLELVHNVEQQVQKFSGYDSCIKHLYHNKHEVTILMQSAS